MSTPASSPSAAQPPTLPACQRWRDRRDRYRPAGERIDPSRYGVELLPGDDAPRRFVQAHHYSGSYPAALERVGLYRAGLAGGPELVGVAVFSWPVQAATIPAWLGEAPDAGAELGRFVLLDDVPANGETWFLARALRLVQAARPAWRAILSYSDPLPRVGADGQVLTPGHIGTIYQAHNARYMGRSKPRVRRFAPDGREVGDRIVQKIRGEERGVDGAMRALVAAGLPARDSGEAPGAWLERVLPLCRRVKHPGNHAYSWRLTGKGEDRRAPACPYPKRDPLLRACTA